MKTAIYEGTKWAVIMDKPTFEKLKNISQTLESLMDTMITSNSDYFDCDAGNYEQFRDAYNAIAYSTVLCEYLPKEKSDWNSPELLNFGDLETYPDIEITEEGL